MNLGSTKKMQISSETRTKGRPDIREEIITENLLLLSTHVTNIQPSRHQTLLLFVPGRLTFVECLSSSRRVEKRRANDRPIARSLYKCAVRAGVWENKIPSLARALFSSLAPVKRYVRQYIIARSSATTKLACRLSLCSMHTRDHPSLPPLASPLFSPDSIAVNDALAGQFGLAIVVLPRLFPPVYILAQMPHTRCSSTSNTDDTRVKKNT